LIILYINLKIREVKEMKYYMKIEEQKKEKQRILNEI